MKDTENTQKYWIVYCDPVMMPWEDNSYVHELVRGTEAQVNKHIEKLNKTDKEDYFHLSHAIYEMTLF